MNIPDIVNRIHKVNTLDSPYGLKTLYPGNCDFTSKLRLYVEMVTYPVEYPFGKKYP
jgi:hypothetical protein